jgi:hypothetical protein
MNLKHQPGIEISSELLEAIRTYPLEREVEHCGARFRVSPFEFYATCPACGTRLKVRSFAGTTELEDVFDAVFEWMRRPGAQELVKRRQDALAADGEE